MFPAFQHLIDRVMAEPFMATVMAVAFIVCMALFRARVKRENRADYKPPSRPQV